jgi:RNA polymerase sigma-70 factor (ECF subfamily)
LRRHLGLYLDRPGWYPDALFSFQDQGMNSTSATLLERLGDRADGAAWERFVDLYHPLIRAWLGRHLPQAADIDDLAGQVLAVVVEKVAAFQREERNGAFRAWLRGICVNRLRMFWRARPANCADAEAVLGQLEDPASAMSRQWDQEHDRHVVARLLHRIEPEFRPATWQAFRRHVLDGVDAEAVAVELGLSANAVYIAKSRVLRRLREEAEGLIA